MQYNSVESLEVIAKLLADIIVKSRAWILDIDLDFYSTGNPYRGLFANVSNLKKLCYADDHIMCKSGMKVLLICITDNNIMGARITAKICGIYHTSRVSMNVLSAAYGS